MSSCWSDSHNFFSGLRQHLSQHSSPCRVFFSRMATWTDVWQYSLLKRCRLGALTIWFLIVSGDSPLHLSVPFPRSVHGHRLWGWRCLPEAWPWIPAWHTLVFIWFPQRSLTSDQTCCWDVRSPVQQLLVTVLFSSEFLGEEKLKTRYSSPLHMMLKFKVFNIYLREGNIGFKSKRSVCQYMYNKASGGSATT